MLREGPAAAAATVAPAAAAATAELSGAGGTCGCAAGGACCWAGERASGLRLREGAPPRLKCSSTAADTLPPAGTDNEGMQMPPSDDRVDLSSLQLFGLHHQYTTCLACSRRQGQRAVQAACLPWAAAATPHAIAPSHTEPVSKAVHLACAAVPAQWCSALRYCHAHTQGRRFCLCALCSRRSSFHWCCRTRSKSLMGLRGTRHHCSTEENAHSRP